MVDLKSCVVSLANKPTDQPQISRPGPYSMFVTMCWPFTILALVGCVAWCC